MKKMFKKSLCIVLSLSFAFSLCSCSVKSVDSEVIKGLFSDLTKISYATSYNELRNDKTNKDKHWRHGMVSGNGLQGFVTSGSPYSDTFIYQNIHFIMPNKNVRYCPDSSFELDAVKQAIVKGDYISDYADYDDVYTYHPGAQMRITMDGSGADDYVRYTDFESSQVGVHYKNSDGIWDRTAFTSMADGAVITQIAQSSEGKKVNLTLSVDDISTIANYGNGSENDVKYKKIVSDDADYITMVGHYPNYTQSELKEGGWSTLTYIVTAGGSKEKVTLDTINEDPQYVGEGNQAVKITDADAVHLITISDRTSDMGSINTFASQQSYELVDELYAKAKAIAVKYSSKNGFDYSKALEEHLAIYKPQFDAVSIKLGGDSSSDSNEALLKAQKGKKQLNGELAERAYYAGRYAYLCCSGYSTSRLYGMWTGEWNAKWGSKYTMDANVNLQTSSMNTGNISSSPIGYAYFILRQLPDWIENAKATHGFTDALQAPVHTDGDCAVIIESCYSYPFRYWNAGTSWMLQPLYETLQCYGNIDIPLSTEFDLEQISAILDMDSKKLSEIKKQGSMKLREDILLPLLTKSANYWDQLLSAEYYTDKDGAIHYEKGKRKLNDGESYCIVPSYSPENNPANYGNPSTANCSIDISACRSNMEMLIDIMTQLDSNADTSKWQKIIDKLPPYLYDDSGALKEWATTAYEENNEHRHLSHLYGVWPLFETQKNDELKKACIQAIENRESENEASHALVHRSLIAARLKDSASLTDALLNLMNHKIHYNSLMTNHDYDRGSGYCTDFAIGYLGIINEALLYSNPGEIELLPALPEGFESGEITGLKTRSRATLNSLSWDISTGTVSASITSDIPQTIVISYGDKTQKAVFKANESKTIEFK